MTTIRRSSPAIASSIGVVDDLVDQVMQTRGAGGPDVHPGPLPDVLDALEDLDVLCSVGPALFCLCCHVSSDLTPRTAGQASLQREGFRAGMPTSSIP